MTATIWPTASDATDGGLRLDDDVAEMIAGMGRDRAVIGAMLTKAGLHPAEKSALTALVADIDLGRVDDRNLPELLLVDERTKRRVDLRRHGHAAHQIVARTGDTVKQLVGAGVDMSPRTEPGWALETVRNDIDALACGGRTRPSSPKHVRASTRTWTARRRVHAAMARHRRPRRLHHAADRAAVRPNPGHPGRGPAATRAGLP
ncbi:hypothetical protein [Nocardia sp. NPDC004750]